MDAAGFDQVVYCGDTEDVGGDVGEEACVVAFPVSGEVGEKERV